MFRRPNPPRLQAALRRAPIVLLEGPRRAGQSTLLQALVKDGQLDRAISFDDYETRFAAYVDADRFARDLSGLRVGLDDGGLSHTAVANLASLAGTADGPACLLLPAASWRALPDEFLKTLSARSERVTLWPLSEQERHAGPRRGGASFVERLLSPDRPGSPIASEPLSDTFERILRGGYFEVDALEEPEARTAWFGAYLQTFGDRDARRLLRQSAIFELAALFKRLAERTPEVINFTELSRAASLPVSTLKRYVQLFEAAHLLRLVPGWSPPSKVRLVKAPRVLFTDTGVTCQQLELTELQPFDPAARRLLSAFAGAELLKQADRAEAPLALRHFRTHGGHKVEWVLEAPDGAIAGVDVRLEPRLTERDFDGLRALEAIAGKRFRSGVVLYQGTKPFEVAPGMRALPLAALWS